MKPSAVFAAVVLLVLPAPGAVAGVVHDESASGDLSDDPLHPTALGFAVGGNTVIGEVSNLGRVERDYITFTLGPGQTLTGLNLLAFFPDDLAFCAFNEGTTSFEPGVPTVNEFLAGIHASGSMVGMDLMPFFVNDTATPNALQSPELGPGSYCFVIQQATLITITSYSLEFVVENSVPAEPVSWSSLKRRLP